MLGIPALAMALAAVPMVPSLCRLLRQAASAIHDTAAISLAQLPALLQVARLVARIRAIRRGCRQETRCGPRRSPSRVAMASGVIRLPHGAS